MDGETIGASGSETSSTPSRATSLTREYLLGLIGTPANDRLRELWRLLMHYSFKQSDLEIMRGEILAAMSARAIKRQIEQEQNEEQKLLL